MRLPAFARRHPGDHLGAVIERLLRMASAGLAGHALGNDLSVRVDENAHFNSLVLRRAMCLLMSNTAQETTNTAPHISSPSGKITGIIKTCLPLSASPPVVPLSRKGERGGHSPEEQR